MRKFYYFIFFILLRPLCKLLYPYKVIGREKVPQGPVIICGNHSSYIDPILIAIALGKDHYIHFMAKKELFKVPIVGFALRHLDAFPVDRSVNDTQSVRTAMKFLKDGEKILMFPEGTRVSSDESVAAKSGAVRLASRFGVPVVPVHLPRSKRIFHRVKITIGDPIFIKKPSNGGYDEIADDLMRIINAMSGETA